MIVYGKHRKKYVLSKAPVSQEYDGAIYAVPSNPDIMVKIYQPEYRSAETERHVIDTANGTCRMVDEFPVDVVYANGRFAGYIFEQSAPELPFEEMPAPQTRPEMGSGVGILLCLIAGIGLSALIYCVLFDWLQNAIGGPYCYWNFKGIPMIIGGWALMILAFLQFRDRGGQTVVLSILGFMLGAVVVFGVIALLVLIVSVTATLVQALLPTVLAILVIVWIVKYMFRR